jgi:hypothetical protein
VPVRRERKAAEKKPVGEAEDPNLRSFKEVWGYGARTADDEEAGFVSDLIADDRDWELYYLVVDTGGWLKNQKRLLSVNWIEHIDHDSSHVRTDVTRAQLEKAPEFDPAEPVNTELEIQLYDYYGRPRGTVSADAE